MPISHRERGLYWNSKRLDTPSPTPHPFEKNRGIKILVFLMNMSGKCTPLRGPPWYQTFSHLGKIKRLMGPRNDEIFFPELSMSGKTTYTVFFILGKFHLRQICH